MFEKKNREDQKQSKAMQDKIGNNVIRFDIRKTSECSQNIGKIFELQKQIFGFLFRNVKFRKEILQISLKANTV